MAFHQTGRAKATGLINFDRTVPVKLACQKCRASHQKCDGCVPVCSRCKKEQRSCDYTPSRRGCAVAHLHKKRVNSSESQDSDETTRASKSIKLTSDPMALEESSTWSPIEPLSVALAIPVSHMQVLLASTVNPTSNDPLVINSYHLSSFYSCFWPAHPFLPPFGCILDHLERSGDTRLLATLEFIGSKYSKAVVDPAIAMELAPSISQYPEDAYSVQTLILLAISHHMSNEREIAKMAFANAREIALSIGLDKHNFATDYGTGSSLIEESWRRTWWELYILDVMFAAIDQESPSRLEGLHLEVLLPCEEILYQSKSTLPEPQTLIDFDSRFFNDDTIIYSSFAYRIAAARTLSKILSGARKQELPAPCSNREVELEMENLILHLPKHMQICSDGQGFVNEVAFQALMMMHAATVYLHRPLSLLASPGLNYTIACAPNSNGCHVQPTHYHTRKAVDAANEICRLITAFPALQSHTPFFICAVAMQAIVHLGIYSVRGWAYNQKLAEEQIKLSIGALRKLGEVWEIANAVRQDVKNVAKALLDRPNSLELPNVRQTVNEGNRSRFSPTEIPLDDRTPLGIEAKAPVNDDSWIDEFLAKNAAT